MIVAITYAMFVFTCDVMNVSITYTMFVITYDVMFLSLTVCFVVPCDVVTVAIIYAMVVVTAVSVFVENTNAIHYRFVKTSMNARQKMVDVTNIQTVPIPM